MKYNAQAGVWVESASNSKVYLVLANRIEQIHFEEINPFTPSDQSQISPATSPERLHHTVWRTWLFVAYSDER